MTPLLRDVLISNTQQRILVSYKKHFCFSSFLKKEGCSEIALDWKKEIEKKYLESEWFCYVHN